MWFQSPHHLLPIRYSLTNTKYLKVRIAGKEEKRYVEIVLGEICKEEEITINLEEWRKLMDYESHIKEYFKSSIIRESPLHINSTTEIIFGKYKNIKIIYLLQENKRSILDESIFVILIRLNNWIPAHFNELHTAIVDNNEKITQFKTFSKNSGHNITELGEEELRYMPKNYLLKYLKNYISVFWEKLPENLKADPEVQEHHRCLEHYNQPWQRVHIDGPAPKIKDCSECKKNRTT